MTGYPLHLTNAATETELMPNLVESVFWVAGVLAVFGLCVVL